MSKSDWDYFNCSEQHEHDYVVSLYGVLDGLIVADHLKKWCADGTINNIKHGALYDLIEEKLNIVRK